MSLAKSGTACKENKFGVIGVGSVGSATIHSLSKHFDYEMYDINEGYPLEPVLGCPIVFVCVPTPSGPDGHLDCSIVESVLSSLSEKRYDGIVVVKSTLRIGFMDEQSRTHPELRLVYMPEFLRELNAYSWSDRPDRIVVSGDPCDIEETLSYFTWVTDVPVLRMSFLDAELGKIVHNAFIATKVSFTNTVEMLAEAIGANPENSMSITWNDRRVRCRDHLRPGLGGYAGKCIPKDTSEMVACLHDLDLESSLMDGVERVNDCVRPSVSPEMPPVYVIVPTRLQDDLWKRAVESIAAQTQRPASVFVVHESDDASGLREHLEKLDPMFVTVRSHGRGLSAAVNTALDLIAEMDPS